MNIYELFALSDSDLVDAVFEAWNDSDDAAHWTADDVRDRCSEDDRSDRARAHFHFWFVDYCVSLDDPYEVFADEHGSDIFHSRIEPLADDFVDAVFESLDVADDFYRTMMSLPR